MQGRARITGEEVLFEVTRRWSYRTLPRVNEHQVVVLNTDDRAVPRIRRGGALSRLRRLARPLDQRRDAASRCRSRRSSPTRTSSSRASFSRRRSPPPAAASSRSARGPGPPMPDRRERPHRHAATALSNGLVDRRARAAAALGAVRASTGIELSTASACTCAATPPTPGPSTPTAGRSRSTAHARRRRLADRGDRPAARARPPRRPARQLARRLTVSLYARRAGAPHRARGQFRRALHPPADAGRASPPPSRWTDGIADGHVDRAPSPAEWPFLGWSRLRVAGPTSASSPATATATASTARPGSRRCSAARRWPGAAATRTPMPAATSTPTRASTASPSTSTSPTPSPKPTWRWRSPGQRSRWSSSTATRAWTGPAWGPVPPRGLWGPAMLRNVADGRVADPGKAAPGGLFKRPGARRLRRLKDDDMTLTDRQRTDRLRKRLIELELWTVRAAGAARRLDLRRRSRMRHGAPWPTRDGVVEPRHRRRRGARRLAARRGAPRPRPRRRGPAAHRLRRRRRRSLRPRPQPPALPAARPAASRSAPNASRGCPSACRTATPASRAPGSIRLDTDLAELVAPSDPGRRDRRRARRPRGGAAAALRRRGRPRASSTGRPPPPPTSPASRRRVESAADLAAPGRPRHRARRPRRRASATSVGERARDALARALRELRERYPQNGALALTGHAHIDLAWLWPLAETRRKANRTFSTMIGADGPPSGVPLQPVDRPALRLPRGGRPGALRADQGEGRRRPVGADRRHVGRARHQHADRRVLRPPAPLRPALLRADVRPAPHRLLAARLLRLLARAAAAPEPRRRRRASSPSR